MPLQNINFNDTAIQADVVCFNTLSSSNVYFDGLDYYLNSSINGVQYLSKLILKESLPFYNFVYSSNTTQQIQNTNVLNYLVVDTAVDTFSATFNSFTIGLSNIFVSSNFNNCRLRVNLGPGLSCNKTNIFVTTDAVLSSNTNQFFTFSYFTTGSLLLGFALSGITPQTTPRAPGFPTPTITITPSITPTITVTPTRTPTSTIGVTPTITPTTSGVSVTPTVSITPTLSSIAVTPTITPTTTVTPTRTPTPTTPTSTIGVTPTITPTTSGVSVTPTVSITPTLSSIAVTPTITVTPTRTPTSTIGVTPTITPTTSGVSVTPTVSITPTLSSIAVTATPTPTLSGLQVTRTPTPSYA